jgi:hypothetical protein
MTQNITKIINEVEKMMLEAAALARDAAAASAKASHGAAGGVREHLDGPSGESSSGVRDADRAGAEFDHEDPE